MAGPRKAEHVPTKFLPPQAEHTAFTAYYRQHHRMAVALAARAASKSGQHGNEHLIAEVADDLLCESYAKGGEHALQWWLAWRRTIDAVRRHQRWMPRTDPITLDNAPRREHADFGAIDNAERLDAICVRLPPDLRRVVRLLADGWSFAEICHQVGRSYTSLWQYVRAHRDEIKAAMNA